MCDARNLPLRHGTGKCTPTFEIHNREPYSFVEVGWAVDKKGALHRINRSSVGALHGTQVLRVWRNLQLYNRLPKCDPHVSAPRGLGRRVRVLSIKNFKTIRNWHGSVVLYTINVFALMPAAACMLHVRCLYTQQ